jgi:hypothetical protein
VKLRAEDLGPHSRGLTVSIKLDHHHRITVQKVFGHPLNHNIKWHDVCVLLERFGDVHETHNGNWAVTVDGEIVSFGSSRARDLSEDQVIKVRRFLQSLGVTPKASKAA